MSRVTWVFRHRQRIFIGQETYKYYSMTFLNLINLKQYAQYKLYSINKNSVCVHVKSPEHRQNQNISICHFKKRQITSSWTDDVLYRSENSSFIIRKVHRLKGYK